MPSARDDATTLRAAGHTALAPGGRADHAAVGLRMVDDHHPFPPEVGRRVVEVANRGLHRRPRRTRGAWGVAATPISDGLVGPRRTGPQHLVQQRDEPPDVERLRQVGVRAGLEHAATL